MIRDRATTQANHDRFVRRIIESEIDWYLSNNNGTAVCRSNDYEDCDVIMFFRIKPMQIG
ncbi:MAG: DUF2750 domain-containing protein [Kangiellaceae bacterium]|nr:DUF2750 domain-containing protein [Kangiellaceae bacterium]